MAINRFQAPDDATMQAIKARGMPQSNRAPGPLGWPALSMASGAVTPAFQSGPMQPRAAVESFDLGGGGAPSRTMVTGDRSLTRNPSGRAGLPMPQMGEQIGSRGMTDQRRSEMAGRRLSSAMRGGDMRATETLFRAGMGMGFGPRGYGPPQGFGPPQRPVPMGQPLQPPQTMANNGQPLPTAPLMPPPMSTEQALGQPGFGAPAAGVNQPPPLPMPSNMPWQGQPLPGFDSSMNLPPSTLMGGAGLPPPPRFSEQQVGGMNLIVDNTTGKQVGNYKPEPILPPPTFEMRQDATGAYRQFYDGKPLQGEPTYSGQVQPGSYVRQATQGQPAPMQYTPNLPQPVERVTIGPDGQETRTLTRPQGSAPSAPPPAANAAKLGTSGQTPSGVKYELQGSPQASTQTGQMPNANYAAPLRPEQMLEEARNEYARTGNDAALKQYFAQYPSEAVRFNQQEQQIWQQIGQGVDASLATQEQIQTAEKQREDYIKKHNYFGPMGQGAHALDWERTNPQQAALLKRPPSPSEQRLLMEQANRLNAQSQAAAKGLPVPASWADDPGRVPAPPPLPTSAPQRPFWQTVGMGANAMMNDLSQLPGQVAAYGRNNPLLTIRR